MNLLTYLCSDKVLDKAYIWCCKQRELVQISHKAWHLRQNWHQVKFETKRLISDGVYRFTPLQKYEHNGAISIMQCMRDAIVVKAIAITLNITLICKLRSDITNITDHSEINKLIKFIDDMSNRPYLLIFNNRLKYDALEDYSNLWKQIDYLTNNPIILNLIVQFLDQNKVFRNIRYHIKQEDELSII